eukprot:4902681-Pyramimonas_sp.AAC.1
MSISTAAGSYPKESRSDGYGYLAAHAGGQISISTTPGDPRARLRSGGYGYVLAVDPFGPGRDKTFRW